MSIHTAYRQSRKDADRLERELASKTQLADRLQDLIKDEWRPIRDRLQQDLEHMKQYADDRKQENEQLKRELHDAVEGVL